jgi:peptidoglycan/LPS O-acetylase OafA/YrhL
MGPGESAAAPIPERRLLLDGLRGVAAIAVVIYHFTSPTNFPLMRGAFFAVDLFFCLSGFVIAEVYGRRLVAGLSAGEFMARRLIRLYPLYFAGLIIGCAALCIKTAIGQSDYSIWELVTAIQCNLLFLPYPGDNNFLILGAFKRGVLFPTNFAAWSLFFELVVNIVFVRTAKLKMKYFYYIAAGSFILYFFAIISTGTQPGWGRDNILGGFPRVFYGFFAGVAVESLIRRQMNPARRLVPRDFPAAVGIATLVLLIGLLASPIGLTYLISLLAAPLFVYCAVRVRVGRRFGALCAGLGWLSYPLYCLHGPIFGLMEGLAAWWGLALTPAAMAALAGGVTLGAATALTHWFEEPTRRFLSMRRAARPAPPPAAAREPRSLASS